jgi:hypothetical protein
MAVLFQFTGTSRQAGWCSASAALVSSATSRAAVPGRRVRHDLGNDDGHEPSAIGIGAVAAIVAKDRSPTFCRINMRQILLTESGSQTSPSTKILPSYGLRSSVKTPSELERLM